MRREASHPCSREQTRLGAWDVVTLLVALGSPAFFVLAAVLGYRYEGAESTAIYIVFSLVIAALGVWVAAFDLLRHGRSYPVVAWMIGMMPALIAVSFVAQVSGHPGESVAWPMFRNSLVWAAPALYMGMYVGRSGRWRSIHDLLDPLMLLLSGGSIRALLDILTRSWVAGGIGGATYQTLSYVSALAFGLNLYLLRSRPSDDVRPFVRSRWYRAACLALLPLQLLAAIASGGRGGVVLIGVYLLLELMRRRSTGGRLRSALVASAVLTTSLVLLQLTMPNTLVGASYDRAFAYLSVGGIDWSGTSGRDVVYSRALALVDERLWLGYGPFGFIAGLTPYVYPHNLVLELLLASGLIGLMAVSAMVLIMVRRYFVLKHADPTLGGLGVLVTYQVVMLMFSGSYLAAATLWFALGLVVTSAIPGAPTRVPGTSMIRGKHLRGGAVDPS